MAQQKSETRIAAAALRELESLRSAYVCITTQRASMRAAMRDAHALALYLVELIAQQQQATGHGWLLSAMQQKAERLRDTLAKELDDDNRTDDSREP